MGKKENWLKHMKKRIMKPSALKTERSRNSSADQEIFDDGGHGLNHIAELTSILPSTAGKITGELKAGNIHAMAIANATAAAAEAAAAAAEAAAEVIRLASDGITQNYFSDLQIITEMDEDLAATKIQAIFRGYLAKKALRALKSLVKLQAAIRGYCVRKQAIIALRCMQTLMRLQARVRSKQILLMDSSKPGLNVGKITTAAIQKRRIDAPAEYHHPARCNSPAKQLGWVESSAGDPTRWGWMLTCPRGADSESAGLCDDVSGRRSMLLSGEGPAFVHRSDDGGDQVYINYV